MHYPCYPNHIFTKVIGINPLEPLVDRIREGCSLCPFVVSSFEMLKILITKTIQLDISLIGRTVTCHTTKAAHVEDAPKFNIIA